MITFAPSNKGIVWYVTVLYMFMTMTSYSPEAPGVIQARLAYLRLRKAALDELILSLERYSVYTLPNLLAVEQALGDQLDAPAASTSAATYFPQASDRRERRALADPLEVVDVERQPHLARDRQQMEDRVGRASGGGHTCDGVLKGRVRQNVADEFPSSAHSSPLRRSGTLLRPCAGPWRERC
jgi:hypothetical protein